MVTAMTETVFQNAKGFWCRRCAKCKKEISSPSKALALHAVHAKSICRSCFKEIRHTTKCFYKKQPKQRLVLGQTKEIDLGIIEAKAMNENGYICNGAGIPHIETFIVRQCDKCQTLQSVPIAWPDWRCLECLGYNY